MVDNKHTIIAYGINLLLNNNPVHPNIIDATKNCLIPLNIHLHWHDATNKKILTPKLLEYLYTAIITPIPLITAIIPNHTV